MNYLLDLLRNPWKLLLIIFYVFIYLSPVLYSNLYSDDIAINGIIKGVGVLEDKSLIKLIIESITEWINKGRFTPMTNVIIVSSNYILTNIIAYKFFVLILISINIITLCLLIKELTRTSAYTNLILLMMPVFFQFRFYHDPILSFGGLMQLYMIFIIGSFLGFARYLHTHKMRNLVLSLLLYAFALMTYEISYLFLLTFIAWSIHHCKNKIWHCFRLVSPYILITIIIFSVYLFTRPQSNNIFFSYYSGSSLNLDLNLISKTFITQLLATTPLIYFLENQELFKPYIHIMLTNKGFFILLVLLPFLAFIFLKELKKTKDANNTNALAIIGISLLIFPALTISLSKKYQTELVVQNLTGGIGYIPVYIQYYGLFILLLLTILFLKKRFKHFNHIVATTLCIFFGLILLLNYASNTIVVVYSNIFFSSRRLLITQALQEGILDELPKNAKILIEGDYKFEHIPEQIRANYGHWPFVSDEWINKYLIYIYSGKQIEVYYGIKDFILRGGESNYNDPKNVYMLNFVSYPSDTLYTESSVCLGQVSQIYRDTVDISLSTVSASFINSYTLGGNK